MNERNIIAIIAIAIVAVGLAFLWNENRSDERFVIKMEASSRDIRVGEPVDLSFSFKDRKEWGPPDLLIDHERIVHVIIIGEDFNEFFHIHPEDLGVVTAEMKEKGRYTVRFTPQKAGKYLIAVDARALVGYMSKQFMIEVSGEPKMVLAEKDNYREGVFNGYTVSLAVPESVVTGEEVILAYKIMKDARPTIDLTPYLGAPMHLAVVADDLGTFFHTHGQITGSAAALGSEHAAHEPLPKFFGPAIEARAMFTQAGLYHVFGELTRGKEKILTQFQIEVQ